eukprot:SAG22_NODE_1616_length_3986_cov_2.289169_5_plen_69_part_00
MLLLLQWYMRRRMRPVMLKEKENKHSRMRTKETCFYCCIIFFAPSQHTNEVSLGGRGGDGGGGGSGTR